MPACLVADGRVAIHEVPVPVRPDECLVRVHLAGICGTDLQLVNGYGGFSGVPGHEFVGVVEAVGDGDDDSWVGRRVVGEINVGCGACRRCAAGLRGHCARRTVLGIRGRSGAFAPFLSLPRANLHAVPDHLPDETAVFAEPVAAACRILEQAPPAPGERVAVLGDGRLGLLAAQVLRPRASSLVLVGRHRRKMAVAAAWGMETADRETVLGAPDPFDLVIDATGRPAGFADALALVRPGGRIVLKSTTHHAHGPALWPVVVDEVTVVGSRCGPFGAALEALASGSVAVSGLVDAVLPLAECAEGFAAAATSLKILLRP